jgi:DNA repair protein RadD
MSILTLRPYQRQSIDAIYTYFEANNGNPLVVLPTGSGKSLVLAQFCKEVLETWPDQRILILTHVAELVQQNELELLGLWPQAPVGVYSAGLGRREAAGMFQRITFAGIQSVFRKADELGHVDLILIDEAHLLPPKGEGMYRTLLVDMEKINPKVKVIGLTATPYRLKQGLLTTGEGRLFHDIAYDKPVAQLVKEGFLAPLVSKGGDARPNLDGVKILGGEYVSNQLAEACDKEQLVAAAVDETLERCADRNALLFFCASVDHAKHTRDALRLRGVSAEMVHGATPTDEREKILKDFKAGRIRAVTNVNVLTTGFNHPGIDALIMLRPTKSTSLYVQMLGRGMRNAPGKVNCLVLDFAGNIMEHGPLDHIEIKTCNRTGQAEVKKAPAKECPSCRSIIHAAKRVCEDCGYAWPERELKHDRVASGMNVMGFTHEVKMIDRVEYALHHKEGSPDSVKVTYVCGLNVFREWVCIEHRGYAQQKAWEWWQERMSVIPFPTTSQEALVILQTCSLKVPSKLKVKIGNKFPEIERFFYDDNNKRNTGVEDNAGLYDQRTEAYGGVAATH